MEPDPDEHLGVNKGSDTYSRRRLSMNSGLNLSPVTYSADGENILEPPDSLRTKSMFVWERRDDTCGKVYLKVIPKENEVLETPPGRGVWSGEYWEIGLRRWLSPVENSTVTRQQTHLCGNQIRDICILRLSEFLNWILDRGD